ncbi:MAG: YraN family protein [Roseococcus sp.]
MPDFARQLRGARADRLGRAAEAIARDALIADGWRVLAERQRTPSGELDLVVEKDALLAFIEVKARPSLREAAFALTPRQQQRLLAAAEVWLGGNPGHGAVGIRFDVMLVSADGNVKRITDALREQ